MQEKAITLKNGQVKSIYEYFINLLQQDGKNATFSYMIYKNAEKLASAYNDIVSKIYNEAADKEFQAFKQKASDLVVKYADRDEQGNIKFDEKKQPIINEQIAEFKEADQKLLDESKELLEARKTKIDETMKFLDISNEYSLIVISLSDFPNTTAPGVVGIFTE